MGLSRFGLGFPHFGWLHRQEAIWFVTAKDGRTKLYLQTIGEEAVELPTPRGTITNVRLDEEDSFFISSWSSLSHPPEASKLELATGTITTIFKSQYDENIPLGQAEFLTYKSFDGLEIPAFMVSAGGSRGRRPCVVWPHGGLWWEVADEYGIKPYRRYAWEAFTYSALTSGEARVMEPGSKG